MYCSIDLIVRFNNPLFKGRMKYSKWNSTRYCQARWNFTGFPELYSNGHLFLKFFLLFSPLPAFRSKSEHVLKTLSILMGLKGGDRIRKAGVKKQCENPLHRSGLCKSANLPNSNVPVAWINRIQNRVWHRVSVILHLKRGLLKRIMESML